MVQKNNPQQQIIRDMDVGVQTRRKKKLGTLEEVYFSLLSKVEPSCSKEAQTDEC